MGVEGSRRIAGEGHSPDEHMIGHHAQRVAIGRWADFTSYPTFGGGRPVYVPDGLTHEGLMALQRQAMRSFYLRPRFILQELMRFKPSKITQYWNGLMGVLRGK